MNIVIVKHPNNYRGYIFEVPSDKELKKGDKILVRNKKGIKDVICDCDSFEASENVVNSLAQSFGATFPLAKVIGIFHYEAWEEEANENVEEETEEEE